MPHIKSSKPQRQDTIATSKKPFSIPHKKVHVLHPVFAVKCIISHCYCSNIIRDKNKIKKTFLMKTKRTKVHTNGVLNLKKLHPKMHIILEKCSSRNMREEKTNKTAQCDGSWAISVSLCLCTL